MDQHLIVEGHDQAAELTAKVAEADEADGAAREAEGAGIAGEAIGLGAVPHGAVGLGDAAGEVDGHPECGFGDGCGEGRGRCQHPDAARLACGVVDIGQEVGLDIEDGAQFRRPVQAFLGHRRLADDENGVGQQSLDHVVGHGAIFGDDQVAQPREAGAGRGIHDEVEGPRQRVHEHDIAQSRSLPGLFLFL